MTSATDQIIERGLRAWTSGDLDALETVLDPAVTLTWVEPGEWDCVGRDQVCGCCGSGSAKETPPTR